jgi:hypothetical protein
MPVSASGYYGVPWSAERTRQIGSHRGRFSRLSALVGALAILACAEATSPENATDPGVPTSEPATPATSSQLQTIGATLVDATDWVLVVITDDSERLKVKSAIGALAEHLTSGHNAQAKKDVSGLRAALVSLGDLGPALGPIGVALDQIEYEFAKLAD